MPTIRKNRQNENSTLSRELKTKCLQKCYRRTTIYFGFFFFGFRATSYCRNRTSEKYAKYVITHNIIRMMIVCPCAQTYGSYIIIVMWSPAWRQPTRSRGQFQGVPNFVNLCSRKGTYTAVTISICIRLLLSILSIEFFKFTVILFFNYIIIGFHVGFSTYLSSTNYRQVQIILLIFY